MATAEGGFCYVEIPAPDLARSKSFYTDVFGWTVVDSDAGEAPYAMFESPGLAGGLDSRTTPSRDGALLYVKVADIPAALGKVERAGGRVVRGRTPVVEGRDFGFFDDPNGQRMGVWSAR